MRNRTVLTLIDGARIVVPDCVDLITPYVLREQGDWFEDEIKFVRRALDSGQRAIDIGANYGVYTLSMARAVGAAGKVWAFEPASATAEFLAASIAENTFGHVVLERSALSSTFGTASLSLNRDAELNALEHGGTVTGASETVRLVTLDERAAFHQWRDIDFVKIDAEGEELNILRGGIQFFANHSPLVQYEIKAGNELHMELVEAFAQQGYRSYRLVPGLDLLAAIDANTALDGYQLNLFCCKPDRAARLEAKGLLVEPSRAALPIRRAEMDRVMPDSRYHWPHTLTKLPYGRMLANQWHQTLAAGNGDAGTINATALAWHAFARDVSQPAPKRFAALCAAFIELQTLCDQTPTHLRLLSLARVAREAGARTMAVQALGRFLNRLKERREVDAGEPFLAPGARFDSVAPGAEIGNWVLAAALEEFEQNSAFSSFYTGASAQQRVSTICDLGFASDEMHRRRKLLEQRFGVIR